MFRKIAFSALALLAAATARPFPLCMYGVNHPADLKTLKKAGITCAQSYRTDPELLAPLAQEAQKQNMQIVFYPGKVIGSAYEEQARSWPVLAWYLVDEPDVWRWTREQVTQANQKTKQTFPRHATTLVIGQGKTKIPFYDLSDTLMVDWYPVPHLDLSSFGDNVRWAKEGQNTYHAGQRPLWGVVQIFDWKDFKQHRPDNDRIGRFPTEAEIRFMSYDGILNGAEGLFYFTFDYKGQPLAQARPEWWTRVRNVTRELARLRPVLEKGTLIPTPVEVTAPLAAQTRLYKNRRYTILLNRSDKPVAVPEDFLGKTYKPLFATQKSTHLAPYTVWVLQSKNK